MRAQRRGFGLVLAAVKIHTEPTLQLVIIDALARNEGIYVYLVEPFLVPLRADSGRGLGRWTVARETVEEVAKEGEQNLAWRPFTEYVLGFGDRLGNQHAS